ncbi:protein of unknown function [Pararobbsia alpina]
MSFQQRTPLRAPMEWHITPAASYLAAVARRAAWSAAY